MLQHKVCVVMPTYNERENLEPTLGGIIALNPGVDVLIVDDNSPDGTGQLADAISEVINLPFVTQPKQSARFIETNPEALETQEEIEIAHECATELLPFSDERLHTEDIAIANRLNALVLDSMIYVLHRNKKEGLGPAYLAGFHWALDHGYDVICEMDMDGSHQPQDLHTMLHVLEEDPSVDLVIGSRRVNGGSTEDWPWYRDLISRSGSAYARFMLGLHHIHDMTAGFRAYRADLLRAIDLDSIHDNGYVFQIDMTRRAVDAGAKIEEVPIVFPERRFGESKMDRSIVREAMTSVTVWGLQRMVGMHPNKRANVYKQTKVQK